MGGVSPNLMNALSKRTTGVSGESTGGMSKSGSPKQSLGQKSLDGVDHSLLLLGDHALALGPEVLVEREVLELTHSQPMLFGCALRLTFWSCLTLSQGLQSPFRSQVTSGPCESFQRLIDNQYLSHIKGRRAKLTRHLRQRRQRRQCYVLLVACLVAQSRTGLTQEWGTPQWAATSA